MVLLNPNKVLGIIRLIFYFFNERHNVKIKCFLDGKINMIITLRNVISALYVLVNNYIS